MKVKLIDNKHPFTVICSNGNVCPDCGCSMFFALDGVCAECGWKTQDYLEDTISITEYKLKMLDKMAE